MTAQPSPRPVAATDRVSDVLARDERLVDVFVGQAPHFNTLRNPAMRRVMARLVTVEQAARVAAIPAESLVRALNDALGIAIAAPASETVELRPESDGPVPPRDWPEVEVDVREDLRSGREPFGRIMGAVGALAQGEVLHLRAIFEPAPLFAVLAKRGFVHRAEAHAADDWSVWFWRPAGESSARANVGRAEAEPAPESAAGALVLDVRGLEPPEPMMRTLAALETLPEGAELVQVNARVPQFLLPMLVERGFGFEIDDSSPERVLVRIRRAS